MHPLPPPGLCRFNRPLIWLAVVPPLLPDSTVDLLMVRDHFFLSLFLSLTEPLDIFYGVFLLNALRCLRSTSPPVFIHFLSVLQFRSATGLRPYWSTRMHFLQLPRLL